MQPRLRLTRAGRYWLAAVAGLALTGVLKNINLVLLLAYFLLSLLVINWWVLRRSLIGAIARRSLPTPVFAGEQIAWRIAVENHGNQLLRDAVIRDCLGEASAAWALPPLESGQVIELQRTLYLTQRGSFSPGPGTLECAAPFGLIASTQKIAGDLSWIVFPRRGTIHWDRLTRHLKAGAGRRDRRRANSRLKSDGDDLHGLRPYRPGDSPRSIHWKTTARTGELMIREHESPSLPNIVLEWHEGVEVEAALSFMATFIWEWSAHPEGKLAVCAPGLPLMHVALRSQAIDVLTAMTMAELRGETPRGPSGYHRIRLGNDVDPTRRSEWYTPAGDSRSGGVTSQYWPPSPDARAP